MGMAGVLDIPELLEAILLHLPTRDLLLSQGVSRHWKEIVDESIALQRALFFEPDKGLPLVLATGGMLRTMRISAW